MKKTDYFSVDFQNNKLVFLDQTKLPLKEEYVETDDYEVIARAIETLAVRGAPLIGIVAAYALALSMKKESGDSQFFTAYDRLYRTRPTAVNLFYALKEIKDAYEKSAGKDVYSFLIGRAKEIHKDDFEKCRLIGQHGLNIFRKKSRIITHCNTGRLATGGDGTAFNVIKTGFENGLVEFVFADETRPLLQGSRLTGFELDKCGIPFQIISDSMSGFLMKQNSVDFAVTGADRIALNGDSANKIGTYNLAVLCYNHDIPFYIAAPSTTIDHNIATGDEIVIEMRNKREIQEVNGIQIIPDKYDALTPAFDVTPAHFITGIITEKGVYNFPYNFLR